jgi:hypothetical protein
MDMYKIALGDGHEEQRGSLYGRTILDLEREDVGRFRDAWAEIGDSHGVPELRIAIYTRNGGGNRQDYEAQTEKMRQHPCYLFDQDDKFDSTYATYYFRFPPIVPAHLAETQGVTQEYWDKMYERIRAGAHQEPVDTDKRWQDAIAKLQADGPTPEQVAAFSPVADALKKVVDGGGSQIVYLDGTTEPLSPEEGS